MELILIKGHLSYEILFRDFGVVLFLSQRFEIEYRYSIHYTAHFTVICEISVIRVYTWIRILLYYTTKSKYILVWHLPLMLEKNVLYTGVLST